MKEIKAINATLLCKEEHFFQALTVVQMFWLEHENKLFLVISIQLKSCADFWALGIDANEPLTPTDLVGVNDLSTPWIQRRSASNSIANVCY